MTLMATSYCAGNGPTVYATTAYIYVRLKKYVSSKAKTDERNVEKREKKMKKKHFTVKMIEKFNLLITTRSIWNVLREYKWDDEDEEELWRPKGFHLLFLFVAVMYTCCLLIDAMHYVNGIKKEEKNSSHNMVIIIDYILGNSNNKRSSWKNYFQIMSETIRCCQEIRRGRSRHRQRSYKDDENKAE